MVPIYPWLTPSFDQYTICTSPWLPDPRNGQSRLITSKATTMRFLTGSVSYHHTYNSSVVFPPIRPNPLLVMHSQGTVVDFHHDFFRRHNTSCLFHNHVDAPTQWVTGNDRCRKCLLFCPHFERVFNNNRPIDLPVIDKIKQIDVME